MYARLGKSCPYDMGNTYQNYYTLKNLEEGINKIQLNDTKFLIRERTSLDTTKPTVYLESPFIEKIITPEQTKVTQNPQSMSTR